ncbi:MAG: 16S rRNA (cytidine(1402)-2'-O)-methyltransferase [Clostridia bacterium]|nr:16S rRNA (cytidine(1402)-2'-O)-methyltransferase [Clostridia bacterium]
MEFNGLYVVATPIGNMNDLSPRALEVLAGVSFVAAEDTRNTGTMLSRLGIKKELVSYHAHNIAAKSDYIISRIEAGESAALVSDAGTPAISDPGEELVRECHERGVRVTPVPGPSAVITAISASGMPTGRFTFEGFLSTAVNSRRKHLESLKDEKRTMVFYEAPHRLKKTLSDMFEVFGDRKIVLARELTKFYEEIITTTFAEALKLYDTKDPLGEFVIIVDGKKEEKPALDEDEAKRLFEEFLKEGLSKKDAVKKVAEATGLSKNGLYDLLIK